MSSRIAIIRTTAFRLSDDDFGKVWVYRPGADFARVWKSIDDNRGKAGKEFKKLPYGGLAIALRVLTGDFVALARTAQEAQAFIVSRKRIDEAHLKTAIASWEAKVLGERHSRLSQAVRDLHPAEVPVARLIKRRPGLCPILKETWVWDVGIWEAARRLAAQPMRTDSSTTIRWRLDSDAALLSWDNLLQLPNKPDAAMHKLTLHLITVPGVKDPVLSIQASLVRLAPTWKSAKGAKFAWTELSAESPVLRGRVHNHQSPEKVWTTSWADSAAEVLRGASLHPLPKLDCEPLPNGAVRTGFAKQPKMNPFGRGVGIWFHECVAHHMREVFGEAGRPVVLETRRVQSGYTAKAARPPLGFDNPDSKDAIRLLVVYADAKQRRRIRDAIANVFAKGAHEGDKVALTNFGTCLRELADGDDLFFGPFALRFVRPADAEMYLLRRNDKRDIEQWAAEWLTAATTDDIRVAAIVETDAGLKGSPDDENNSADPKTVLRRFLASRGVATQFITRSSSPTDKTGTTDDEFREHAAANAVCDLLRSAGFFLRPFPAFDCCEKTIVVGIHGVRLSRRSTGKNSSYVVNLAAVSLGTRDAWGYIDKKGWVPLHEATVAFLASDQARNREDDAKALVERAVGDLCGRFGNNRNVILLFDAFGCRRFWDCLTDKSTGTPEAWMTREGYAIVRVRTAINEVLRPAGMGDWSAHLIPATHTPFRLMSVEGAEGVASTCVLAGSAVMSRERSARHGTRFAFSAAPKILKKDWHSLGITELKILAPGPFNPEALLQQVAILCRVAPTWDRTLRWPSPLHLARAVVRDHPHGHFDLEEQDEDKEDEKQMRLDF